MSGSFSDRWTRCNHSDNATTNGTSKPFNQTSTAIAPTNSPCQILTPLHYQSGYQYPLFVWLHSAGSDQQQIERVLPHISTRNYVGLGVQATMATDVRGRCFDWQSSQSGVNKACQKIRDAIELTQKEHSIHPDRIILAGLGSGATMACRVALESPNEFAGVIRMSGRFGTKGCGLGKFNELRQRRLPMLWQQAINGIDDDAGHLHSEIVAAQWLQAQVEIRQYVDNDVMNTTALKDIDRWCFDKIMNPPPADGNSTVSDVANVQLIPGSDLKMVEFSAN